MIKKTYSLLLLTLVVAAAHAQHPQGATKFTVAELLRSASYKSSSDFLQNPTMRARLFNVPQSEEREFTHEDAGVYYVLAGEGKFVADGKTFPLVSGSLIYFGKNRNHKIRNVTRKLVVLGLYSKADNDDTVRYRNFTLEQIGQKRVENENTWEPFIKNNTMTLGLYMLPESVNGDSTLVHKVNELNVVTKGSALFSIDGVAMKVQKGDIIYVEKGRGHYFHDLKGDFDVLILWEKKSRSN